MLNKPRVEKNGLPWENPKKAARYTRHLLSLGNKWDEISAMFIFPNDWKLYLKRRRELTAYPAQQAKRPQLPRKRGNFFCAAAYIYTQ